MSAIWDSPQIRMAIGLDRYLQALEPLVEKSMPDLRTADIPAVALSTYTELVVSHTRPALRTEVRAMVERVIAQSVS